MEVVAAGTPGHDDAFVVRQLGESLGRSCVAYLPNTAAARTQRRQDEG